MPPTGGTADLVDPVDRQGVRTAPVSSRRGRRPRLPRRRRRRSRAWRDTTPAERQLALLRIADPIEAHADELVDAGGREHRQAARR